MRYRADAELWRAIGGLIASMRRYAGETGMTAGEREELAHDVVLEIYKYVHPSGSEASKRVPTECLRPDRRREGIPPPGGVREGSAPHN